MLGSWEREGHKRLLDLAGVTRHVLNNAVGAFIGTIIEQHGDKANLFCDKDPLALKMMIRLSEIFPQAKFILMIRDARATVHSMIVRKVPVSGFDRTNKEVGLIRCQSATNRVYSKCSQLGIKPLGKCFNSAPFWVPQCASQFITKNSFCHPKNKSKKS